MPSWIIPWGQHVSACPWQDALKLVSDLLVGLGWPAAVVFVALVFRREIQTKFKDIVSAGPAGVTFRMQDAEAAGRLEELRLEPTTLTPTQRLVEQALLNDLKKIDTDHHRIEILVKQLVLARLARHFEGLFAVIFGSQIEGLKRLRDNGGQTSLDQAKLYFDNVKNQYPDFYQAIDFQQWFRFLQTTELASPTVGGTIKSRTSSVELVASAARCQSAY